MGRSGTVGRVALLGAVALGGCVVTARNVDRGARATPLGASTAPIEPPESPSDEATAAQLQLAREQGNAAERALDWWLHHGCASSGRAGAGEYEIAYALRAPRGAWTAQEGGGVAWRAPEGDVVLAVVVLDGGDLRPVPGLGVRAQVTDAGGRVVFDGPLAFRWDVPLEEYAAPLSVAAGELTIKLTIAPPGYWRHDPVNGDRFAEETLATFSSVRVDPGARIDEGDREKALALARDQGDALARAYLEMSRSVANDGAQVSAGDYRIGYAVEFAETFWRMEDGGHLAYFVRPEQSAETNAHVEVAVFDALTGRFLPGLDVRVTVLDAKGQEVSTEAVPFMWHPWVHHYGRNWRVPGAGVYRLRVHVAPPPWPRGDREWGHRFAAPADVEFRDVRVLTGQK